VERLIESGRLPKVVLSLKEPAGISLVVLEDELTLEVIGDKVYMDIPTFNTLFKMSLSKAKTPRGKKAAVTRLISDALKMMVEDQEYAETMEGDENAE